MDWSTLLSTEKLAEDESEAAVFGDYPINTFEKDYNKIVSSAAFRRLQDKTQVFPLDKSDFVRTRLTHSIEVSTIARQLGIMISKNTTKYRPEDIGVDEAEGISSVLLCSGLLHDLGNPPFGHFGETTIRAWFRKNLDSITYKNVPLRCKLTQQMAKDLENFEGNAQAFRILAKAKYNSEINLSFAVISALIKYPNSSLSFDKKNEDVRKHKPGYYLAEEDVFHSISQAVGTINEEGNTVRHPLAYMVEAADDIAYATADLEDALKKNLFSLNEFILFFEGECKTKNGPELYSRRLIVDLKKRCEAHTSIDKDGKVFRDWIAYTRRWLMYVSVFRFSKDYISIMNGEYRNDLFYGTNHSRTIEILKDATRKFVFNTPGILKLELSSHTILSFLLDKFVHAVLYYNCNDEGYKPSDEDKRYLSIFSNNYMQDYNDAKTGDESMDLYLRLLMVTDYISGMTDTYARTLYRELNGIE